MGKSPLRIGLSGIRSLSAAALVAAGLCAMPALPAISGEFGDLGPEAESGRTDDRVAEARRLHSAGKSDVAAEILLSVLKEDPDNSEALALAGQLARSDGDREAARVAFERALSIDPDNDEARAGLDWALAGSPMRENVPVWMDDIPDRYVGDPNGDPDKKEIRIALERTQGYSKGQERGGYHDTEIRLGYGTPTGESLSLRYRDSMRSDERDRYVEAGFGRRLLPWLDAKSAVGVSPGAEFLPRLSISGEASARIQDGSNPTVLALSYRFSHHRDLNAQDGRIRLRQYLQNGRMWLTGTLTGVSVSGEDVDLGWKLRADYALEPGVRLFGGVADTIETEEGREDEVRSLLAGVSVDLFESASVVLTASREERNCGTTRYAVGMGLELRF
jgi:YaiO family outer membrane protein